MNDKTVIVYCSHAAFNLKILTVFSVCQNYDFANVLLGPNSNKHQGPVVQSIVSLTMSFRRQLVNYIPTTLSNMLLFIVGKM